MGRGGDARLKHSGSGRLLKRSSSVLEKLSSLQSGFDAKKRMRDLHNDLTVLKNIWFKKLAKTDDHAERLEQFYGPQAHAYDSFRSKFLWGRKPLLAACAARLDEMSDMVWVDLGGGTGVRFYYLSWMVICAISLVFVWDNMSVWWRKKVVIDGI